MPHGASIEISQLSKHFPAGSTKIPAADNLSITCDPGTMTAVTGPSGSGKSTLLHLLGAIEQADSGTILVDGEDITSMRRSRLEAFRRNVGFVFQRYHLLPALTALDNVLAPLIPHRVAFDKVARARELLDAVGLGGRDNALPGELSGGQQQRVAIARALVGRPRLLLADEPTGNLDSRTGETILDLLIQLRTEHGAPTMLLATHELRLADACDRIIHLTDGRIIEDTAAIRVG
ncbi:ABC transporter ATP-binding protein [Salinispora pacifica]|uniref:ABC transporter ATP-binding protein n=1 Tax=Salinispora pacifica TaxID=351187 RepID=UPI0004876584|nr:ABC transporter ATP-binding protein [Salinispora pacifica]